MAYYHVYADRRNNTYETRCAWWCVIRRHKQILHQQPLFLNVQRLPTKLQTTQRLYQGASSSWTCLNWSLDLMQINCYFLYDYGNTVLTLIFLFFSDALYTFSRPLEAGKLAGFRKKERICIRATSVLWAIKSASVNRFPLRIFRAAISLRKIHPSYWLEHRTFNIEFLFRTREFTALGCSPKPSEIW